MDVVKEAERAFAEVPCAECGGRAGDHLSQMDDHECDCALGEVCLCRADGSSCPCTGYEPDVDLPAGLVEDLRAARNRQENPPLPTWLVLWIVGAGLIGATVAAVFLARS